MVDHIIDLGWAKVTPTGLLYEDDNAPSFEKWSVDGLMLATLEKSLPCALGDWLNYGEKRWGDKYTQALDVTNYSYSRLATFAYVCRNLPICRRRQELEFAHYEIVAPLSPQDQEYWQDMAILNNWSSRMLLDKIKGNPTIDDGDVYWFVKLKDFLTRIRREIGSSERQELETIVDFERLQEFIEKHNASKEMAHSDGLVDHGA